MVGAVAVEALASNPSFQATLALVLVSVVVRWYFSQPPNPKFPKADLDESDWHGSLMKAKTKYQNRPFIFGGRDPRIILPNYLFQELKDLPDDQLSFRQNAYKMLNGKYTGLGKNVHPLSESVKNELTMNINITLALLQDEIQYAIEEGIGDCPDWTPVKIFGKLLRIVALASGRIFVGRPLCRDEEWIDMTINYTVDSANAIKEVQDTPRHLRPFLVPFKPSIRKAATYRQKVAEKLKPQLNEMIEAHKNMGDYDDDNHSDDLSADQHSLALWSMSKGHYEDGESPTAETLADTILAAAFAAIHTTTMTLTNVLFDLAAHPKYADELREEIKRVSVEEPSGRLRKKTMPKLKKLDSFIKESQRVHPLGSAMLLRLVTAPNGIQLSSGDYLPHGSVVAPSLDEFHPWRFNDLRTFNGEENKHQFVTTTTESTVFGHGRWACPGRFFASNEIKAILIQLLARYDIAVGPAGQAEGEGEWKRPSTFSVEMGYYPDPEASIYFKDRELEA
ncbi:Cytochrome P450 [Fusarium albosuccineum]|uniref:Cytochrome P450 n=1 Tax=Fusarium albosuccineum TaxID=1237068 RepID=A0A8H4PH05_9HYPO|nr:Cytochrome P450 [Fusarium albosuccineum]